MFFFHNDKTRGFDDKAMTGRSEPIATAETHFLTGRPLKSDVPEGMQLAMFGMGCFWGVERKFWETPGVWLSMVGYAGGDISNPTYDEVCSGRTGHNEVVRLIFDPAQLSYEALLQIFWEGHDPTQGMRQGNDIGTQYRSGIYTMSPEQLRIAEMSREVFARKLRDAGFGDITTEIMEAPRFFYAEGYHQQYLAKNPGGYCGLGGTGVACPIGIGADSSV